MYMNKPNIIKLMSVTLNLSKDVTSDQETFICSLKSDEAVKFHITFDDLNKRFFLIYDDIDDDYSEESNTYNKVTEKWLKQTVDRIVNIQIKVKQLFGE